MLYPLHIMAHLVLMTHWSLIYFLHVTLYLNIQKNTKHINARMAATSLVLSIADTFDGYGSMESLLRCLGLSARCTTHFMDEEGFETARDLALASEADVKSTIENVKKILVLQLDPTASIFPHQGGKNQGTLCIF